MSKDNVRNRSEKRTAKHSKEARILKGFRHIRHSTYFRPVYPFAHSFVKQLGKLLRYLRRSTGCYGICPYNDTSYKDLPAEGIAFKSPDTYVPGDSFYFLFKYLCFLRPYKDLILINVILYSDLMSFTEEIFIVTRIIVFSSGSGVFIADMLGVIDIRCIPC